MVLLDTCIWYFYEYFHPLVRICLTVPALLILSTSYARERANDIISFAIHVRGSRHCQHT